MSRLLFYFLCLLVIVLLSITFLSCYRTYKHFKEHRRSKRLRQYAKENRGKIGHAQQWHCWECNSVMLSNYEIVQDQNGLVALCNLCGQRLGEKYRHIYGEDEDCKDFDV